MRQQKQAILLSHTMVSTDCWKRTHYVTDNFIYAFRFECVLLWRWTM
jgi:hypothetical protein